MPVGFLYVFTGDDPDVLMVKVRHDGEAEIIQGTGNNADDLAKPVLAAQIHKDSLVLSRGVAEFFQSGQIAENEEPLPQLRQTPAEFGAELIGLLFVELSRQPDMQQVAHRVYVEQIHVVSSFPFTLEESTRPALRR